VLVFLDADVTIAPGALDRVVAAATRPAAGLVSVQPWHAAGPRSEQASLFFNLVAVMAAGVAWPMRRGRRPVAFGPVLATTRENYLGCGGHAHPDVRASIVDDIALAGRYAACGQSVDVALDRSVASFRMYPGGGRPLLEGWTKNIAAGAAAVGPGAVLAVAVWIAALVGGPLASPWLVLATVPQVHLLGRRVGRFGVLTALLYPLPLALFVVVALRSGWRRAAGRPARWRGRSVPG
jgi:4,4'-diaponeurosporenoate glycosyltransferase